MPAVDPHSFLGSLSILFAKGVRYGTFIDVGCADGHLFLNLMAAGLFPGAVPLHIDPNPIYEDSLKAIQEVVGGHYRMCAITDREGEIELTMSVHPYWTSLRPAGDSYWGRINHLIADKRMVPATMLDTLHEQLGLKPPFLLKLDVQGAESAVLRGAKKVLTQTHVVICEADVDDFQSINAIMLDHNFVLFDVTNLNRIADGTLGWFYPVYVNRALDFVRPKAFWSTEYNQVIIRAQAERRAAILKSNAEILARLRKSL